MSNVGEGGVRSLWPSISRTKWQESAVPRCPDDSSWLFPGSCMSINRWVGIDDYSQNMKCMGLCRWEHSSPGCRQAGWLSGTGQKNSEFSSTRKSHRVTYDTREDKAWPKIKVKDALCVSKNRASLIWFVHQLPAQQSLYCILSLGEKKQSIGRKCSGKEKDGHQYSGKFHAFQANNTIWCKWTVSCKIPKR